MSMFEVSRLKDINIKDKIGSEIIIKALINNVDIKQTKKGADYIVAKASDGNKKIGCKIWNLNSNTRDKFKSGCIYEMTISVEEWEGNPSCIIKGFKELSEEKVIDYVGHIEDSEKYIKLIEKTLEMINHESVYYKIVSKIVTTDVINKMVEYPAASKMHHNIIGGILMHTGTMLESGYTLAQIYKLNIDLVMSGILLHDLGKFEELSCNINTGEIKYTVDGGLEGHIFIMANKVYNVAKEMGLENSEEIRLLTHCILSHHGKREWGAVVEPAIPEALVIHTVDSLDAEMYKMLNSLDGIEPGDMKYEFGRTVYKSK